MTALFIILTGFMTAVGGYIHGVEHGKKCDSVNTVLCKVDTTQSPYVKKPNHKHDFGGRHKPKKDSDSDNDK